MGVRDELVQTGVELLERDGLAQLTLREIARQAGVSHGAPRHHFPTYDRLLTAIARTGVDDFDAQLTPALELADAREALRQASLRYVSFAVARPEMFELISRHDLLDGAGGNLRAITSQWFTLANRRIHELDPTAGDAAVMALWSGVHGLAVIASRRTAEAAAGAVPDVEQIVTLLLERLACSGSAQP